MEEDIHRCPFCYEEVHMHELLFGFRWADLVQGFYAHEALHFADRHAYKPFANRTVYMRFTRRSGRTSVARIQTWAGALNEHPDDPLISSPNWERLIQLIRGSLFDVHCHEVGWQDVPVHVTYTPRVEVNRKGRRRTVDASASVRSTMLFCPRCGQQLDPECFTVDRVFRVMMIGRKSSGKTVYVTQLITGIANQIFSHKTIDCRAVNDSVNRQYTQNAMRIANKELPQATSEGWQLQPMVYILKHKKQSVMLVLQDIAGEDTTQKGVYQQIVKRTDLFLFFVDPWMIPGYPLQTTALDSGDFQRATVEKARNQFDSDTVESYISADLDGVFYQLMEHPFSREEKPHKFAAVILAKGDDCMPPMLQEGTTPDHRLMQEEIPFDKPRRADELIARRSSLVHEHLRPYKANLVKRIESTFSPLNTRYFIVSALSQTPYQTGPQSIAPDAHTETENDTPQGASDMAGEENPLSGLLNQQFSVNASSGASPAGNGSPAARQSTSSPGKANDQRLSKVAKSQHVVDPIFWLLMRHRIIL